MERTGLRPIDELIQLAKNGNGLAFTALWDRHIDQLRSYIKNRFKNIDDYDVDDIFRSAGHWSLSRTVIRKSGSRKNSPNMASTRPRRVTTQRKEETIISGSNSRKESVWRR